MGEAMSLILAKYIFTGPKRLAELEDPESEGIMGIFYLKRPDVKVADYGVLYIGEISEMKETPGFPATHPRYEDWVKVAGKAENLYVGFCATPGIMPKQRESIKRLLIHKYNPPCNK
jgi:hypothetical protein